MKYCEFFKNCKDRANDNLCLEFYDACRIRNNNIKYRIRYVEPVDDEIKRMIELGGYVPLRC